MTVEEIYLRLKDELTAENESSASPERIFIKNDEQTICTLGMNRSHEIIFVEFKPSPKDLQEIEKEGFVHPHPVEMLHDAGWRQAQITTWEEAEKLLEIIHRSYKRKRPKPVEEAGMPAHGGKIRGKGRRLARHAPAGAAEERVRPVEKPKGGKEAKQKPAGKVEARKVQRGKPEPKKGKAAAKPQAKAKPAAKAKAAAKPAPKAKAKPDAAGAKGKQAKPAANKARPAPKKAKAAVKPKAKAKKK